MSERIVEYSAAGCSVIQVERQPEKAISVTTVIEKRPSHEEAELIASLLQRQKGRNAAQV